MDATEYEIKGTIVSVEAQTGAATIYCHTDRGPIQLCLTGSLLAMLSNQIAKQVAQERNGGLYMLPAVEGCHGLEASPSQSRFQIRLVLENGLEGRLPIQETAMHRLNEILTNWLVDQRDEETP